MRVIEAAQRGRIKVVQDGKGGVTIEGRRGDVERIQKAVAKRERRNAKRLESVGLGNPVPDAVRLFGQRELLAQDWPVRIIDARPGTIRTTIVQPS